MRIFNRKSSVDSSTPPEVNDFYHTEQSENRAIALLLAAATFTVTLLLILGLFFGGKWAYRKIANKGSNQTVKDGSSQTTTTKTSLPGNQSSTSNSNNSGSAATTPNSSNSPQTSSTSTSTPSQATTPAASPASTDQLPRTGPDQDL